MTPQDPTSVVGWGLGVGAEHGSGARCSRHIAQGAGGASEVAACGLPFSSVNAWELHLLGVSG